MLAAPPAMQQDWPSLRRAAPAVERGVPRRHSEMSGALRARFQENSARQVLLFCPHQGGWRMGSWMDDEWRDFGDLAEPLDPTHFALVPDNPA